MLPFTLVMGKDTRGVDPTPPARTSRYQLGILGKLLLLIAGVVCMVVATLAIYFPSQQLARHQQALEQRAHMYGRLATLQARSAVAFDDRETAREILRSVAEDPLVTGLGLYTEQGQVLHEEGALSRPAQLAGKSLRLDKVFRLPDRLLCIMPVQALEGKRGTLALEVSTSTLTDTRNQLIQASILVGSTVFLVALLIALFFARSLTRRVALIADEASAVALGDLNRTPVPIDTNDEIGALGAAFNSMVRQLRALLERIEKSAKNEQHRLEGLVQQRTQALAARNQDLRLVMDNVEQGFLTVDREGVCSEERSRCLDLWFGAPHSEMTLFEYLDQAAPGFGASLEGGWEQMLDGVLPLDVALDQLPRRFEVDSRHFSIALRPIVIDPDSEAFDKVLVVISDISATLERTRTEAEERNVITLAGRALKDPGVVQEFLEEMRELIKVLNDPRSSEAGFERTLHTLKGSTATFGLAALPDACHALEEQLAMGEPRIGLSLSSVVVPAQRLDTKMRQVLMGLSNSGTIDERDRQELLAALRSGQDHRCLIDLVQSWDLERVDVRLRRAGEQLQALADRLGKAPINLSIECDAIRSARQSWQPLWTELVHILRNTVDHGLESPAERLRSGKPASTSVLLRARKRGGHMALEVEDHGRGIDWCKVETRALEQGLIERGKYTQQDVRATLFQEGLSTAARVTQVSGRGVGLAAIHNLVTRCGGRIEVESKAAGGSKFTILWPLGVNSRRRPDGSLIPEPQEREDHGVPLQI